MKYFTNIILKTPRSDNKKEDKCPDPKAGVVLTKYDCKVDYIKSYELLPKDVESENDVVIDDKTGKQRPKLERKNVWLVDILIPNKHIINDTVYDLEAIQNKLEDEDEEDENLESVVSNNDEVGE